ncbi:hypothetical protein QQP08_026057 [Theobroma cacao]|nr:hypothetical protein QQP08_026057 [Theobroma cacao]
MLQINDDLFVTKRSRFWNSHSEHSIFHGSLNLIHLGILRQSEPPHELATATFHTMPSVVLVFLLYIPLSTYLKHPVIFNLHLHFFFLKPWKISLEDVSFWGFLPVNPGVDKSRGFWGMCGE